MRRTTILSMFALGAVLVGGLALAALARGGAAPSEGAETVALEVQGMQSILCELGVRSALARLAGVEAVAVDRAAGEARVTFDPAAVSPAAMVAAVEAIGFRATAPETVGEGGSAPCAGCAPVAHPATPAQLGPEEVERVAAFVAGEILATEEIPSAEAIARATGLEPSIADTPVLQEAVLARLAADPRGQELLAGSRCSDYGACSLWGNLATATGDMLALYEQEKALDGTRYEDRPLPAFEARDLGGHTVHSADLAGRPAVVALLAVHCTHSMDTFPILGELHRRFGPSGLQVVGVLVNSGSVADANGWVPRFAPEHPVWVVEDDSLGDLVGSHLVPTYLLVDAEGEVREILVGYRDLDGVLPELDHIRTWQS